MNRAAVLLVTGVFWAFMMAALVKREILPQLEYASLPTYRTFRNREAELERWSIHLGKEQKGEIASLFEPLPNRHYRTRTRMAMRLKDMPLTMRHEASIDPSFQLSRFQMTAEAWGVPMKTSGARRGEDKLALEYEFLGNRGMREVDFPRDAAMMDGFMPHIGGGRPWIGQSWPLRMMQLTPGGLQPLVCHARVERKEAVQWHGTEVQAFVVEILRTKERNEDQLPLFTLWVDENGGVLINQMSFGGLLYTFILEEKRAPTAEEVKEWDAERK